MLRCGISLHRDSAIAHVIGDMNPPQDVKRVQRLLGICIYLSRFTPNLCEVVKPLTELLHSTQSVHGPCSMTKPSKQPNEL